MNEIIRIEKAVLMHKGELKSGEGQYGAWKRLSMKVGWEYMSKDAEGQPVIRKMSAVVVARGDMAELASGFTLGNPYLHTPDTYLNLTLTIDGRMNLRTKKDGSGQWEDTVNNLIVQSIEVVQV